MTEYPPAEDARPTPDPFSSAVSADPKQIAQDDPMTATATDTAGESAAVPAAASPVSSEGSAAFLTGSEAKNADAGCVEKDPDDALPPVDLVSLPQALQDACMTAGWTSLMPVQARALPYMLEGRDIMVQSRTGSGKTGAYLLPLLARLDPAVQAVQALILTPTRELAVQVEREAAVLFRESGLSVCAVYGGVSYGKQMNALRNGVAVVVGTPGRILDHLLRRTLSLDHIRALVLDEADRMLSIGFYPDMKEIQRYLPRQGVHATLFSATYPPHVLRLAGEFLQEPQLLSLSASQVHVAEVQHLYCECKRMDKDRALLRVLEVENPASAIIFCNTKADVHYVAAVLQGFGFNADELSADLSQSKREDVLGRLRRGEIRFLVATDVAARGIDIPDLSHVVLYTPPEDRESYIHRAGRTGRAGAAGVVISLVDVMEKLELQRIARFYKISLLQLPLPSETDAAHAAGLRVTALLEARKRQLDGLERERLGRFETLAREMAEEPEHLSLLALLLDDCYQRNMNPTGFFPVGTKRRSRSAPEGEEGRERPARRGKRRSGGKKPAADARLETAAPVQDAASASTPPEEQDEKPARRRRGRRRSRKRAEDGSHSASSQE